MTTLPLRTGLIAALCLPLLTAAAAARAEPATGQLLYVPVYSEVPFGNRGFNINLTATLSVRNTDRKRSIMVQRVDYYGEAGDFIRSHLNHPQTLKPMASATYIIRESDRSGGINAAFLVEWTGEPGTSPPFVEAVMVNTSLNQGIAFSSPARVLESRP
jgi:hypothetical protein